MRSKAMRLARAIVERHEVRDWVIQAGPAQPALHTRWDIVWVWPEFSIFRGRVKGPDGYDDEALEQEENDNVEIISH